MKNDSQIEYWNGPAGQRWVSNAERLDALLAPFSQAVLESAALVPGERVLDVGCGAGALTLKAAGLVGRPRGAVGVDVSLPLVSLARRRAEAARLPARFEVVDAAEYGSEMPVDAIVSRFGVMFFDAPEQAFSSLRESVRPEGRMTFACWQSLAHNDWARAPLDVALPLLPAPPAPPPPGAPGPFAFADKDRVARLLDASGWRAIQVEPWTGDVQLPGRSPAEVADFMLQLGPVARLVAEAGLDLRDIESALADMVAQRMTADGRCMMSAAAWIVSATAS